MAWTKKEDNYIKKNYLIKNYHQIAKDLGKKYYEVNQRRFKLKLPQKISGSNSKKPTCIIIDKDLVIYIAGLFDGEGTISIFDKDKKLATRIAIGILQEDVIKWLKDTFNCGIIYKNKANIYMWAVNTREDLKILIPQIIPYLRIKKKKAEELLYVINNFKRGQRG